MTAKKISIWILVVAGLFLLVWGLGNLGAGSGSLSSGGTLTDPVAGSDHAKGNSLATTILAEYSDFQCPACATYYPLVKQLAEKYGGDVMFVYRHYPLTSIHANAELAAFAAEAAGLQGKFWEMHDRIFETQTSWSAAGDARAVFTGYAEELGLDTDKFMSDLDSPDVKNKVKNDVNSGNRAGVNGTPTFYLNGEKLTDLQTYGDLERNIQEALQ